MFCLTVDVRTELRLIETRHREELFQLFVVNRVHLRTWHPWADLMRSVEVVEKAIGLWQELYSQKRACHAGIWFQGKLCGMISFMNVDCSNHWTALFYWLDASHQGKGIMTACCRAMVAHGFESWDLNRITIECATENQRSRAIPERLGFKMEGIVRGIEWLHDHFADHAMYGMLKSDFNGATAQAAPLKATTQFARGDLKSIAPLPLNF